MAIRELSSNKYALAMMILSELLSQHILRAKLIIDPQLIVCCSQSNLAVTFELSGSASYEQGDTVIQQKWLGIEWIELKLEDMGSH